MKDARRVLDTYKKLLSIIARRAPLMVAMTFVLAIVSGALIAFTMSSIGVAVPVQGGIGPWHFMVIATLVCFGVGKNDAAAFALVVHTIQTVWVIVCGLFGIVALPITNKKPEAKVLN